MTLEPRDVVVTVFAAAESSMAEADAVIEADRRAAKLEVLRELECVAQLEENRMRASGFPAEHVAAASWGAAFIRLRSALEKEGGA